MMTAASVTQMLGPNVANIPMKIKSVPGVVN